MRRERERERERETNNKKEDSGRHKTSMMRQKEINNIKRGPMYPPDAAGAREGRQSRPRHREQWAFGKFGYSKTKIIFSRCICLQRST